MNKSSYLIVKTGKSGSKLNDLYDTEVLTESGKVKLCSTRLLGTWYQSASDAEWMRIAQDGLVTPIRPRSDGNFTKFKWNINRDGMSYLEYKRQLKELKKTCKERVAAAGEAAISNQVKLIEV